MAPMSSALNWPCSIQSKWFHQDMPILALMLCYNGRCLPSSTSSTLYMGVLQHSLWHLLISSFVLVWFVYFYFYFCCFVSLFMIIVIYDRVCVYAVILFTFFAVRHAGAAGELPKTLVWTVTVDVRQERFSHSVCSCIQTCMLDSLALLSNRALLKRNNTKTSSSYFQF